MRNYNEDPETILKQVKHRTQDERLGIVRMKDEYGLSKSAFILIQELSL